MKQAVSKEFVIQRIKDSTQPWFHRVYIFDWVFGAVLFIVIQIMCLFIEPFHRYLPENDASVDYPSTPDIIPDWLLGIISPIIPFLVIVISQAVFKKGSHDFHHAMLALLLGIMMTNNVVNLLKLTGGRYRPDWRNDETPDRQGRFSFPSGHAANAWAGMTFLSLYLMGKFKVFGNDHTTTYPKVCAITSPLVIAAFVAISRTMDYHHHFSDIIAGGILGTGISAFTYLLYFPNLWCKECDTPKFHVSKMPRWDNEMGEFPPKERTISGATTPSPGDVTFVVV